MKKDMKIIDYFIFLVNESLNVKFLCMFWISLNNLMFLIEFFYEIVNEKNICFCYNLYVFLFGICCYKYFDVMLMIDDKFFGNFEDIKECVFMFMDDEDNFVINIFILLIFFDRFVVIVIE